MLYEGALSNIAIARKHFVTQDRQLSHIHIDKAVAIVQELQASLQDYKTNELSANLFDLYSYIVTTLMDGDKKQNDESLAICANLVGTLLNGWQAIRPERIAA